VIVDTIACEPAGFPVFTTPGLLLCPRALLDFPDCLAMDRDSASGAPLDGAGRLQALPFDQQVAKSQPRPKPPRDGLSQPSLIGDVSRFRERSDAAGVVHHAQCVGAGRAARSASPTLGARQAGQVSAAEEEAPESGEDGADEEKGSGEEASGPDEAGGEIVGEAVPIAFFGWMAIGSS